jgi:tryptophanyl-tRNA synthetase
MTRILTGIQPSGTLHLGNYFGALLPIVQLQDEGEVFFCLVDLHALTSVRESKLLHDYVRGLAIDSLACGIDPERAVFWRQSHVPMVTELTWILSTVTPMGLLERAHAYKDKVAKGLLPSTGLFTYPVLQAADILLYDAERVPVGKDQKQHLEITRDIAVKLNEAYGEVFKLPEPDIPAATAVVPGIDGQKMSKSYGNTLEIFGDEKTLRKQVMSIVTDSSTVDEPKDPTNSTIVALYRLVASPDEVRQMEAEFRAGGVGYGEFKKRLFASLWEYFAPMRARREELLRDPAQVESILQQGAARAQSAADQVMARVRAAVGLD